MLKKDKVSMEKFNTNKKEKKSHGLEIVRSYDDVKSFMTSFALFTVYFSAIEG